MQRTIVQDVFQNYLAAFAVTSPPERESILRSSVAADISFSNPGVNGHGIENLAAHIARFQERFPGGRFRVNWIREQHDQILAEWTQLDANGRELLTAHSYAMLDDNGRIKKFAGFWADF